MRIPSIQSIAIVLDARAEGIGKHIILRLPKIIRNWLIFRLKIYIPSEITFASTVLCLFSSSFSLSADSKSSLLSPSKSSRSAAAKISSIPFSSSSSESCFGVDPESRELVLGLPL